jgi:hypothetical protein
VDASRFDSLIRLLADSRSRRGLLGGALSVLAGPLAAPEVEAKRKRHTARTAKRTNTKGKSSGKKKRTICHCPPGNEQNCQTIKVSAKAAKMHLKKHQKDHRGACPPLLVCEGSCDNQQTCSALGENCVCRTLDGTCGTCIADGQPAGGADECCTETFCEREGLCGECPPQTCPGGSCTATSCGTGCTCVSLGGGATVCAALGTCPAGTCTAGSCGAGCTCVSPGAVNSRCVSTGACPAGNCIAGGCGTGCVCLGTGLGSRCIATVG